MRVRRLPFYSELLTTLGPAAARELTTTQQEDVTSIIFERFHFSPDDEEDFFADWRTRPATKAHEAGEETKACRNTTSRFGRAPDLYFEREVQTIEQALRRREVLGVERWLQLRRCSARVDRVGVLSRTGVLAPHHNGTCTAV